MKKVQLYIGNKAVNQNEIDKRTYNKQDQNA